MAFLVLKPKREVDSHGQADMYAISFGDSWLFEPFLIVFQKAFQSRTFLKLWDIKHDFLNIGHKSARVVSESLQLVFFGK